MAVLDEQPVPRHWPGSLEALAKHGKVPGTQINLYRIVFAPTRRHLVGGAWPDGFNGFRWGMTYRHLGPMWVMERWLPAFEFTLMSRRDWEAKYASLLGPYPKDGEFQHCHSFEACSPDDANLDKLVMWLEEGRKRSRVDKLAAIKGEYDDDTKARRSTMDAIIRDKMPEHLGATSGRYQNRVGKSLKTPKTAMELGLPQATNKFVTTPRKPRRKPVGG